MASNERHAEPSASLPERPAGPPSPSGGAVVSSRTEHDALGPVVVPAGALYGAQTQRAIDNFTISGRVFDRRFIGALGTVKLACAGINDELGLLEPQAAGAIKQAAGEVAAGLHDAEFPVDVYQTGSGTSTNMNANEVIANRANQLLGRPLGSYSPVHPNDHVNRSQSSNDVIPTTLHVAVVRLVADELLPALERLSATIQARADEHAGLVKTGRTHLMDATPLTVGQEMSAWASQVTFARARLDGLLGELKYVAIGGTAVGTGLNAPPGFGKAVAARLAALTGHPFLEAPDHFAAQAGADAAVATSAALKCAAVALVKIANDLRWLGSGPNAGLGELDLPALQPGSSIMPGKINPVIPEAVAMACARVVGNDTTVTIAGQGAHFQLAANLPVVAECLLESATLLAASARALADKVVAGMTVREDRIAELVLRNTMLVTALVPLIGYDRATQIATRAHSEGRPVKEVARELTNLSPRQLDELLDPGKLV